MSNMFQDPKLLFAGTTALAVGILKVGMDLAWSGVPGVGRHGAHNIAQGFTKALLDGAGVSPLLKESQRAFGREVKSMFDEIK